MEFPMIDETQNYIRFCQQAGLPINEVPEKGKPMAMTYEIAMREIDPHLYERLTTQGKLKADVLDRHKRGAYWTTDVDELEAKGYTGIAANIRKEMAEGQKILMQKEVEKITARNAERDKKIEAYKNLTPWQKMAMNPPTPESIARARAEWGITGEPTY